MDLAQVSPQTLLSEEQHLQDLAVYEKGRQPFEKSLRGSATQTIQHCTSCCQHSSRSSCRKAASGGSLVRAPGGSRRGQADAAACTAALSQTLLPAGAGKTGRQAARFQAAGQCAQRGGSQPAEQVDCRTAADQTEHEDGRGDKAGCCCSHAATPGSSTSSTSSTSGGSRSRCSCKGSGKASLRVQQVQAFCLESNPAKTLKHAYKKEAGASQSSCPSSGTLAEPCRHTPSSLPGDMFTPGCAQCRMVLGGCPGSLGIRLRQP